MPWWRSSRAKSMNDFLTVKCVILKIYFCPVSASTIDMHAFWGLIHIILMSISFAQVLKYIR